MLLKSFARSFAAREASGRNIFPRRSMVSRTEAIATTEKMGIGEAMTLALFLKLIIHFAIASARGERLRYFGNTMNSESGRPLIEG